jgi:4-amino-4-deoxy-L-arabinose transferase-like glycosyltransferase
MPGVWAHRSVMLAAIMKRADAPRRQSRHERRPGPWLLLFVVALSLRALAVTVAGGSGSQPSAAAADYDRVAWNLTRGAGFRLDSAGGVTATAIVPPVVPWVTSLLYHAVGHRYFAALLLQCVLGALVPLLLAMLGGAMFGGGVGLLAGWVAALHPHLILASRELGSEVTLALLLLLAVTITAEWVKTPRPGRALGAGLAWGLAALTQERALLLPVVIAVWAWVPLGLTVQPRERVRQLLLLALGVAIVVAPWTLRNAAMLHAFVPIVSGGARPASLTPDREVLLAAFLISSAFAAWGVWRVVRGARRWFQLLPAVVIAWFIVATAIPCRSLWMLGPAEPLIVLYAASGFDDARRRWRGRSRGFRVVQGGR